MCEKVSLVLDCRRKHRPDPWGHEDSSLELMLETSGELIHVLPLLQQGASPGY